MMLTIRETVGLAAATLTEEQTERMAEHYEQERSRMPDWAYDQLVADMERCARSPYDAPDKTSADVEAAIALMHPINQMAISPYLR